MTASAARRRTRGSASGSREIIDEPRLEARRAARAGDQAVGRSAPTQRLVGERARAGSSSRPASAVPGRERDQERLAQQVAALDALVLAPRQRRVLERRRRGAARRARTRSASVGLSALLDQHLDAGHARAAAHGPRHQRRERARERADPQPRRLARELRRAAARRARSARRSRRRARAGPRRRGVSSQSARLAVEQPRADLRLQRRDLLGDRRLRQRRARAPPR